MFFPAVQEASGKTHTIQGSEGDPGVIPRAMDLLFAQSHAPDAAPEASGTSADAQEAGQSVDILLSMLEIHNETVRDLLPEDELHTAEGKADGKAPQAVECPKLEIRSDSFGATAVGTLPSVCILAHRCCLKNINFHRYCLGLQSA